MRRRRQIEAERGHEQLRGTFAQVISRRRGRRACRPPTCRAAARARSGSGRSSPRIPPRPSGSPCWRSTGGSTAGWSISSRRAGPRASARRWSTALRNEIELLWLTGELRLAKPTVPQEVYWGLHFFNETLFEAVPDLLGEGRARAGAVLPGRAVRRCRPSSSSAPGSAATATAIRSSPTTSPAARCWRTGSPVCAATTGGWASWCGRSASPSAPSRPRTGSARRSSASSPRPAKATRSRAATRARSSASTSPCMLRRLEVMIRATERGDSRRRSRRLCLGRRAHRRPQADRDRAAGARAARRSPTRWCGRCGARWRRSGSAPCGSTCGRTPPSSTPRCARSGAPTAGGAEPPDDPEAWRAWLAGRAGPPAHGRRAGAGAAGRRGRDAGDVRAWCARLRDEIDREAFGSFVLSMTRSVRRRARRVPAGQDRRPLRRRRRGRELHAADRAAVRDHRRPPAGARHHAGAARRSAGAPERAGAGRGAGGDDRLLRLEQGRRLPRVQLGALQGADQADPAGARVRACRSPSSTDAAGR